MLLVLYPPSYMKIITASFILNGKINVSSTWTCFVNRVECGNGEGRPDGDHINNRNKLQSGHIPITDNTV